MQKNFTRWVRIFAARSLLQREAAPRYLDSWRRRNNFPRGISHRSRCEDGDAAAAAAAASRALLLLPRARLAPLELVL